MDELKVSDKSLKWWADNSRDVEMRFIAQELQEARSRLSALQQSHDRLLGALRMIYDKWENGVQSFEACDGVIDESGSSLGNAFNLSLAEEQTILNLIVDKCEPYEQPCANCGKPYRAHLLHDHNKCSPKSSAAWFPDSIRAAIAEATPQEEKNV